MTETLDLSLAHWMTRGGDARITLDPVSGTNRYHSTPYPRDVLAFASSTANDPSPEAFAFLSERFADGADKLESGEAYSGFLDQLRAQIRSAYALDPAIDIFFAPSGTDLEYVGLLAVANRGRGGIANLLLGADEVGSGCIHSAAGRYFAKETALGTAVEPGQPIAGLPPVTIGDLPVRDEDGGVHSSDSLRGAMERAIAAAIAQDRVALLHIVHGSKTGLVLPHMEHVDALRERWGEQIAFVVDACQARITAAAIRAYLARGIIVFLTGSKFMGGPPFSGFALLPSGLAADAAPIAPGMATVFRRAEIPAHWPGRHVCEDSGNAGLALRLAASLFELRRFQKIPLARVTAIVSSFTAATDRLADDLTLRKVASVPPQDVTEPAGHPIEMLTLATLDLCHGRDGVLRRVLDIEQAGQIHRALIARGIRLGQPVRCVRLPTGEWGATLRIGLSMPCISRLDTLGPAQAQTVLEQAMARIGKALAPLLDGR